MALNDKNTETGKPTAFRDRVNENDETNSVEDSLMEISSQLDGDQSMGTMPQDSAAPENPQLPFEEQLMRELREHIFNKMPIRLLCFEPHGSSFQISLIERGAIYARVASALQAKIHDPAYIWADSTAGKEADDEIIGQLVTKHTQYAILSHTWFRTPSGEVSYGDWNEALFDANDPGYQKLVSFCKVAWRDHGLAFGWMDTVCINKQSSSELDESIRSMYNWYNRAAVCIVYLAETRTLSNVHLDPWFTRGWTLQELLAPEVIKSYDEHWKRFVNSCDNDKEDKTIMKQIKQATTISKEEFKNIRVAPISRIMQLAAPREVTREEDTAYSLMGIFDASISTAYGEGAARAFSRLLQEILASREDVLDILNWAGDLPSSPTYTSRILPSSPKYYINRYSVQWLAMGFAMTRPTEPLTLTHLGLRVQVVLMPGMSIRGTGPQHDPFGDYCATVDISPLGIWKDIPTSYHLLDNRVALEDGWKTDDLYQMTFAVVNFNSTPDSICLPRTCSALGLRCYEHAGKVPNTGDFGVVRTNAPIVFELEGPRAETFHDFQSDDNDGGGDDGDNDSDDGDDDSDDDSDQCTEEEFWQLLHDYPDWDIKKDELAKHGMQLICLYL